MSSGRGRMQSTDMNINVAQLIQGFPYICLPALTFPSMLVTISSVQSMYRAGRYAVALQGCSCAICYKRTRDSGQQNGEPCEISLTCEAGMQRRRMQRGRFSVASSSAAALCTIKLPACLSLPSAPPVQRPPASAAPARRRESRRPAACRCRSAPGRW